jgi:hypothetical protein
MFMPKGIAVYAVLSEGAKAHSVVDRFKSAGFPGQALSSVVIEDGKQPSIRSGWAAKILQALGCEPGCAAMAGSDLRSGDIFVVVMCGDLDSAAKAAELLENSGATNVWAARTSNAAYV